MIDRARIAAAPKSKTRRRVPLRVVSRASLFGPAPILVGEDSDAYAELLARVSADVKPSGVIEELWVRDVVDLTWEILRYRRLKMNLVAAEMETALANTLSRFVVPQEIEDEDTDKEYNGEEEESADGAECELANKYVTRDPAAVKQVDELLASVGLTIDNVIAQVFADEISIIERIDHLSTVAEGRRNAVLREIDRRRASLASKLHDALRDVEEAKYETIERSKRVGSRKAVSTNAA